MADETKTLEHFPSAKLRLIIRFDDTTGGAPAAAVKGQRPPQMINGTKDPRSTLVVVPDPNAPPGSKTLIIQQKGATSKKGGPQDQEKSADGLTQVVAGIVPKQMKWEQISIRQGHRLSATLRFADLPFDPRCVRSCAVKAFLGTVTAEDFRKGIEGELRQSTGEPLQIIPDQYTDDSGNQRTNLRFQGWVDSWEVVWPKGEPIVQLECRDNTALLIDQEHPPQAHVDSTKPIHEAVALYLSNFPQFEGLSVQYQPFTKPDDFPAGKTWPPVLGEALAKTAIRANVGPPAAKGGGASSGSKTACFDYLTDVVGSLGHIIRVDGDTVIVQEARTMFSNKTLARPDDPYKTRQLASGTAPYRRFVYGRNLSEQKVKRVYGKRAPHSIEVRSYSTKDGQVIAVRFPDNGFRPVTGLPGDGGQEQRFQVVRVTGITDKGLLKLIAQSYYEQISRNELQVTLKTKNLTSFGGTNMDPDILDMKVGDNFELLVNRADDNSSDDSIAAPKTWGTTANDIEENSLVMAKTLAYMKKLGYDTSTPNSIAQVYARCYAAHGFQTTFRTTGINYTWSTSEGIVIDIVGKNYIEVRSDPSKVGG